MVKGNKKPTSARGSKNSGKAEKITKPRLKNLNNEVYLNLLKQKLKITTEDKGTIAVQTEGIKGIIVYLRDKNQYYLSSASKFVEKGKAIKIFIMEELKENIKQLATTVKKKQGDN